jgi:hypothetical protein
MAGGRERVRTIACDNLLGARISICGGDVSVGLDSRINAMLMGQIKAYVDARVDEKIADALENRGVNVRFGVSVPEMTSQQLSELDTFIKNRVAEALRQSSL